MKVSRYPDTKFNNFGVRNGELYAGDVTESGRRVKMPSGLQQTLANYTQDGGRFNMLRNSFGTSSQRQMEVGVDVEGSNVLFTSFGSAMNLPFSIDLWRCASSAPFKSTRGLTAGKTLKPLYGGIITDENDDVLYTVRFESSCNGRYSHGTLAAYGGVGPTRILCENDTHMIIQTKATPNFSSLVWLPKTIDAANNGADGNFIAQGAIEFEHVGVDVDGRNIIVAWCDNYSGLTGLVDGGGASSRIYVMRETAAKTLSFTVEAKHAMGYSSGSANGAHGFAASAPMNVSRITDANGAVTSFSILTVDDQRSTNTPQAANLSLQWATFTIGTGITKALQAIPVPGAWVTGRLAKSTTTDQGTLINVYPMIHGDKVRALITLGTYLRRGTSVREMEFPITIYEQAIVNGQLSGAPTFVDLPDKTAPGLNFFTTLPDYQAGYLWQLEDAWGLDSGMQIRCIDLVNKTVEYTQLTGTPISVGVHRGRLLAMLVQQGGSKMHKFVLEPDEIQRKLVLAFDQALYQQGSGAVLTITSNANLDVVVELDGCQMNDGSDSVPVTLVANTPYTLNVTVTGSPSATISKITEAA